MARDEEIERHVKRIETVIEALEAGDVSLAEAQRQYDEATDHLSELRDLLDDEGDADGD